MLHWRHWAERAVKYSHPDGRIGEDPLVSVRTTTTVAARRDLVWIELERIEDHVRWMSDATAIRFHDDQRRGVGTRFECHTKIGPIQLTDHMEIIEWEPNRVMGVRHSGAVAGTGRFVLRDTGGSSTHVEWEEQLSFPWWLGGPVGARLGQPFFRTLWKKNLRRLGERVIEQLPSGERATAP